MSPFEHMALVPAEDFSPRPANGRSFAQALLVWRLRRIVPPPHQAHDGFVSILKPVCGLDDELEANLERGEQSLLFLNVLPVQ